MGLPKDVSKIILILNNSLSDNENGLWMTVSDIRNRLVVGGVDRLLRDDHVEYALTRCNRGEVFMRRRKDKGTSYYRSPLFDNECPAEQRWKESGLPDRTIAKSILPQVNILKVICNTELKLLNNALIKENNTMKHDGDDNNGEKKANNDTTVQTINNENNNKAAATTTNGSSKAATVTPMPISTNKSPNTLTDEKKTIDQPRYSYPPPPPPPSIGTNLWLPKRHNPSYAFTLVPPPSSIPTAATDIQYNNGKHQQVYTGYWTPWQLDTVTNYNEGPHPLYGYRRYQNTNTNQHWNIRIPPPPPRWNVKVPQTPKKAIAIGEAMIEMASEPHDFGTCLPCAEDNESKPSEDSMRIVRTSSHRNFIREATLHASKCGISLEPCTNQNSDINQEQWECPRCGDTLNFLTCKWVRTGVVERGRNFSRAQAEINPRIIASARENGINMKQAHDFLAGIGIPHEL